MNFVFLEAISSQTQPGTVYGNEEIGHVGKAIVDYRVAVFETRLLNSLLQLFAEYYSLDVLIEGCLG